MARMLLVGLDDGTRGALRCALEAAGHAVTEATDARAALALLRLTRLPCVVLARYTNLWPDGAAFARAVAADPVLAARHAYILATTDRSLLPPPTGAAQGREIGIPWPVLLMPFELDALLALVDRAAASIPGLGRRERRTLAGHPAGPARVGTGKPSADGPGADGPGADTRRSGRQPQPHAPDAGTPKPETRRAMGREADARADALGETGRTGAAYLLAMTYARGAADGAAAASDDAPDFLAEDAARRTAWDVSSAKPDAPPMDVQEEYCVGWARGYTRRAGEVNNGPGTRDELGAWEDDGGRAPES